MTAARIIVVVLGCSSLFAEETKAPSLFMKLVKPGLAAKLVISQSSGKYDIRIYSKRKKLEILAEHQKRLKQQEERIKALDQQDGLQKIGRISRDSGLYRVQFVGDDFVAFRRKPTELLVIPTSSIRNFRFEQTEEDIEKHGNNFEAIFKTESD